MSFIKDITKTRRLIIYPSGEIIAHDNRYESKEAPCLFEAFHKRKKALKSSV